MNAGDRVLVPAPGCRSTPRSWPNSMRSPSPPLGRSNDWQPDVDEITSLLSTPAKALVLINPNNPTGSVTPGGSRTHCCRLQSRGHRGVCRRNTTNLCSPESYRRLDRLMLKSPWSRSTVVQGICGTGLAYWLGHRLWSERNRGDWCEAMAKMERSPLGQPPLQHAIPAALQQRHPEIEAMREALRTRAS